MARLRYRGSIPVFTPEPEPDNPWPGIIFLGVVILLIAAACGG